MRISATSVSQGIWESVGIVPYFLHNPRLTCTSYISLTKAYSWNFKWGYVQIKPQGIGKGGNSGELLALSCLTYACNISLTKAFSGGIFKWGNVQMKRDREVWGWCRTSCIIPASSQPTLTEILRTDRRWNTLSVSWNVPSESKRSVLTTWR